VIGSGVNLEAGNNLHMVSTARDRRGDRVGKGGKGGGFGSLSQGRKNANRSVK
jgi:hypothetical protein